MKEDSIVLTELERALRESTHSKSAIVDEIIIPQYAQKCKLPCCQQLWHVYEQQRYVERIYGKQTSRQQISGQQSYKPQASEQQTSKQQISRQQQTYEQQTTGHKAYKQSTTTSNSHSWLTAIKNNFLSSAPAIRNLFWLVVIWWILLNVDLIRLTWRFVGPLIVSSGILQEPFSPMYTQTTRFTEN